MERNSWHAGAGCGVGVGLGWGRGCAVGSQYINLSPVGKLGMPVCMNALVSHEPPLQLSVLGQLIVRHVIFAGVHREQEPQAQPSAAGSLCRQENKHHQPPASASHTCIAL